MDFFDLDDEPAQAKPKPSKFAPKSRFAPKSKQPKKEPAVKPEPPPPEPPAAVAPVVVVKEEEKMEIDGGGDVGGGGDTVAKAEEVAVVVEEMEEIEEERNREAVMELVEEEDFVVAEFDVYFTPRVSDTQLYVLQYPLRPSWRPYEMDQKCTEVRVKSKSAEVEVDLSIDMDSENYDPDAYCAEKMNKLTLSSLWKPPQATGYAVGVLSGKKLYLNPVHAVVQLRPSMNYLNSGSSKKRNAPETAVKVEGSSSASTVGQSRKQSQKMDTEEVESWIPLKYHTSTSDLSEQYLRKMVTEEDNPLQFPMNPYDYLNSLCPGTAVNKTKSEWPSRRSLLCLPLEERLKTWLAEGPPIQRFSAIKYLAPDDSVEAVLQVLQRFAHLVQGLWVAKTAIRLPNAKGAEPLGRDYALLLFSQSPIIKDSEFDILGSHKAKAKAIIREIAIERSVLKDWKFKEPSDLSFMKLYPDVVEQQRVLWEKAAKPILNMLNQRGKVGVKPDRMSMSRETREALPKILKKLFQDRKVCSFQTIRLGLQNMAVSMSALPKADAKAAVAAALSADSPEELKAVLREVAVNVHGVYIWKSSDNPEFEPYRNVVIELLQASGKNTKIQKDKFMEAFRLKVKRVPTDAEYQKILSETCVYVKGSGWMLKSGDGDPI